jgi:lysozyme family protein
MSYFKGCLNFNQHFSPGQAQRMRNAIVNGNRKHIAIVDTPERFNAIWRKSTEERPAIWGWARADFEKRQAELQAQGYRLEELNAFVLPGQGERFNAIWRKSTEDKPAVWGWARVDFDKRQAELQAQGYHLEQLNAFVL